MSADRTPWESLRHSGLLLGPAQVRVVEQDFAVPDLRDHDLTGLRREILRLDADPDTAPDFVHHCLTQLFGFGRVADGSWQRAQHVAAKYKHTLMSGEDLKPRQVWTGAQFGVLPVFFDAKSTRLGLHGGRKTVSDVLQWLRRARLPAALITNARQWRIVHAGLDSSASSEADLDQWLEEGREGLQLIALRHLLQPRLWDHPSPSDPPPLATLVSASRKGQAELSSVLGERVREAVEELVRSHGNALRQAGLEPHGADIYRAAVRVVMRMVVVLFSESRDLLPKTNPAFYDAYSLQGLFEQLQRQTSRGRGRLSLRHAAWPRILALFRLIFHGSPHEHLTIREYGGALFTPGDPASPDPVFRAIALFESACFDPALNAMPDDIVHAILEKLTRTRVRIRQGRGTITTSLPVDFADLSTEYIGILYEGLLDYELRTAPSDDAVVFLALGNEPSLPLRRLEAMDDAQIKSVIKEFGKKQKSADASEDADDDPEEDDPSDQTDPPEPADLTEPPDTPAEPDPDLPDPSLDHASGDLQRALAWSRRACLAAGLVKAPRGRLTPEKQDQLDRAAAAQARAMLRRVVPRGEWFLVRWGGTRKGAGTFYTRPQLAIPLVQRTLRPLAYTLDPGADPADDLAWTPKTPEQILALKVADIACGSGSFPVSALRYLTDALYRSLWTHRRIQSDACQRPLSQILGLGPTDSAEAERLPVPPEAPDFEVRTKALLRRYVVERCIYGVDYDPIAAELCRLALWIETMDRDLPFSFLDHKIKHGNSLVGAWFDQYRHYPVMAWKREGGDKTHSNGVHFPKEARTRALKDFLDGRVKPDLEMTLTGQGELFGGLPPAQTSALHDQALAELRLIHDLPVHEASERARRFQALQSRPDWLRLKAAFDLWCACWFWPADRLDAAPLPSTFSNPPDPTRTLSSQLAAQRHFFHWELEFPDVFHQPGSGFDAIVGNPPWEISKPSSKEFFSNLDPLYRTYGKQEALRRQTDLFAEPATEQAWLDYCAQFKSMSQFVGHCAFAQGDPNDESLGGETFSFGRGNKTTGLHRTWRTRRAGCSGYADPAHSFRHQGSADLNLYKLFLEHAHALLKPGGRLGYIVPSGVYSDHGSGGLRSLFLDQCQWEWLFGYENREKIFEIDSRFKFNPLIVQKGGATQSILTAFMRRDLDDWAAAERFATPYARERVERFSPKSRAILEIQSPRDLEILEKIYSNSVLLGDQGPDGWGIKYATEFHMTNDSKLFPPRPKWEEQGYQPDEYSRWLKGNWQPVSGLRNLLGDAFPVTGTPRCAQPPYDTLPIPRADLPPGLIVSRDASQFILEGDVEDIALPLYQGVMVGAFECARVRWMSGTGLNAKWDDLAIDSRNISPQFMVGAKNASPVTGSLKGLRVGFRDIARTTDQRTMICCLVPGLPCGNKVPFFSLETPWAAALQAALNSFVFDWCERTRQGSTSINYYIIEENPIPRVSSSIRSLAFVGSRLGMALVNFSPWWLRSQQSGTPVSWKTMWPLCPSERMRLRCIADVLVAAVSGLQPSDLNSILFQSDWPASAYGESARKDTLVAKGFWRVDKDKDPELRHTVLTLVAFHDLQARIAECDGDRERGIEAFLNQNNGEGWMLPETLRLADYGLGHDERAQQPQPVASRLGPRFLDWQLAQSPEESWRECHLHARNLLGPAGYQALLDEINGVAPAPTSTVNETPAPYLSSPKPKQGELF